MAQDKPLRKLKVPDIIPDISKQEIAKEQIDDPSLFRVRERASDENKKHKFYGSYSRFFWQDDLLYQEFKSPKVQFGDSSNCRSNEIP